jgi:hypothetical protein
MSTLGVWTFFLALAAFIFSFSSYVILCKCRETIETIERRLSSFVDDYNWDHFHGQEES